MIADRLGRREERATLANPPSWLVEALGGGTSYVGRTLSPGQALGVASVFAAVRVVSETIGMLPLIVYKDNGDIRERARQAWQYRLLTDMPNGEQSPSAFVEMIATHIEMWGNAYVEKVKTTSGKVGEVWAVAPNRVVVSRDKQGRKRFTIDGASRSLGEDTILHIPGFSTDNLIGLSPIQVCRQQLGVMDVRMEHEANVLRRGAQIGGVIERPKDAPTWSDTAKQNFVTGWRTRFENGGTRAGSTPVLEDGMTFKPTQLPMKDLQFIEARQADVAEVARIFRIPPSLIGGSTGDSLTYGNREQDAVQLLTFSILPRLKRIEGAFFRDPDLFPRVTRGLWPEFLVDSLLRADTATRSATYATALDPATGWMTRDEVRRLENLPADKNSSPDPSTEPVTE